MTEVARERLENYVLDATANDYENLSSMASDIAKWASRDSTSFSSNDLANAIEELVRRGKLRVYKYSKTSNKYETTEFSKAEIDRLWFFSS